MILVDASGSYIGDQAEPLKYRLHTEYIVVHHAGAVYKPGQALRSIFNHHNRQWPRYGRIGYQVVLQEELDGSIRAYIVNPLDSIGAHVKDRNGRAVGVCAATNFGAALPPEKWFKALVWAVNYLQGFYPSADIVGHKDIAVASAPTSCPGSLWAQWHGALIQGVVNLSQSQYTRVIGVRPSVSLFQFERFLIQQGAPIDTEVISRVYEFAEWLDIDPAYVAAVWHKEQWTKDGLGLSQVGIATRNPFNIKAYGRWPSVKVKGATWNLYESWQLGLFSAVLHLKQFYGAEGLLTVEEIAHIFAPSSDGNDPVAYAAKVKQTMKIIQGL